MSLIIATGSFLENKLKNLETAKKILSLHYELIKGSDIFESVAVDYFDQPDFFNQLLEFKVPNEDPQHVIKKILEIEHTIGRVRNIDKGPRVIDIDIIFWGLRKINSSTLTVPHPEWHKRSFVVRPLQQLPFFKTIQKYFIIPDTFKVETKPI